MAYQYRDPKRYRPTRSAPGVDAATEREILAAREARVKALRAEHRREAALREEDARLKERARQNLSPSDLEHPQSGEIVGDPNDLDLQDSLISRCGCGAWVYNGAYCKFNYMA